MGIARLDFDADIADEDDLMPTLVYVPPSDSGVRVVGRDRRGEIPANIFLSPPRRTDPPPPWTKGPRARTVQIRPRRPKGRFREEFLFPIIVALAAGIVFNLAIDVRLRQRVAIDADHAAKVAAHHASNASATLQRVAPLAWCSVR